MTEFFRTQMGHKFFEGTLPELVRQIARLNDNLERLCAAVERDRVEEHGPAPAPEGEARR